MIDRAAYDQFGNLRESDYFVLPFPPNSRLARAFFIHQRYTTSFPPREALEKGTMFPELYSPWPTHYRKGM